MRQRCIGRDGLRATVLALALGLSPPSPSLAETDPVGLVEDRREKTRALSRQLWDWAELGYLEERSAALLQSELREAGFEIDPGVAGLPTAFIASAGAGAPVVAILAEFDALPGISQTAAPRREPRAGHESGHACGHNLFGAASTAAAIAAARWLEDRATSGTVRLYGTPAEEGGSGKVYMTRAGLFDDVDVVLHWHPSDRNDASPMTNYANKSAKFRFRGVSSHAAMAPEQGRSALDGVEAMTHMVNLLREHVPEETRIHYVITDGGKAPNVVPERAEVFFYVRHPRPPVIQEIWDRLEAIARGAALGTGTEVSSEIIHGNHSLLPNDVLARVVDRELRRVGPPRWDAEMRAYAEAQRATLPDSAPSIDDAAEIRPYAPQFWRASTDVGDVSWVVPTAGLRVATWVPGTPAHTWQAAAASGSRLGEAGLDVAAKVLAATAVAIFREPSIATTARAELERRVGPGFAYRPLLGDREPPLDYRR